jgi:hypothetical protein
LRIERRKGGDVLRSLNFERYDFETECASCGTNVSHLQDRIAKADIADDCQPAKLRDKLAQ